MDIVIIIIAIAMFCYIVYIKDFGTKSYKIKLMTTLFLLMIATDETSNSYLQILLVVLQLTLMVIFFIPKKE
ncbi:hypothetical protein EDI28_25365 [Photobacterium chitinilyticum]|uniref:Uncharacterized protein n=1 Tax=Photobacterium chitinilyticum TaxID=2485123 RepID=A0A444JI85_9GAMM|nr:hypothetical protein EDI28_25365 [Photobacterium chitinilyticum]